MSMIILKLGELMQVVVIVVIISSKLSINAANVMLYT